MEIELKLALDARHAAALARQPELAGCPRKRQALHSEYFDTPDFALMRRGIALRLRRVGHHRVQTLKAETGQVGALTRRPEWEVAVAGARPDFAVLPREALELLHGIDLAGIVPVFVTEFRRVTWQVPLADGGAAEVALDRGEIRAGEVRAPLSELEIELKSGDEAGLFTLADGLLRRLPLRVEPRGKAQRGYLLAGARVAAPVRAVRPALHARQDAGEAWAAIVRAALAQLVANVPGFLEQPDDIEYLHQLRVALRRLRAAAALSGGLGIDAPAWVAELRALMQALNPARDWDVFMEETLPRALAHLSAMPPSPALLDALRAAAARARAEAQRAVAAPACTALVLRLERLLLTPPHARVTARDWSAALLDKRWKNLRKLAVGMERRGPGGLHEMRIAAKKLRYAADALAPLHGKRAEAFLKALAALQDGLGQANDVHVAMQLLRDLRPVDAPRAFEAGLMAGVLAGESGRHGEASAELWRRLAKTRAFWRED